jgi:hypothetical protein
VAQGDRALDANPIGPRHMEIGMAHARPGDPDQDLGSARYGDRNVLQSQGLAGGMRPDGEHRSRPASV